MKKAFLDQILLGFLLAMGIATFVATVSDETSNRNKLMDLKQLSFTTADALKKSYENNMNMCYSKTIVANLLRETRLGNEVLALASLSYDFYDELPVNADLSLGDGEPDTVKVSFGGYQQSTFWYRLFNKKSFSLPTVQSTRMINIPQTVTIRYGERPAASYQNIMGTYQLDANNCVTNMKMHMASSKDYSWENKIDPNDPNSPRIPIADGIKSPPTYIFAVANGFTHFSPTSNNMPITLEDPHCFGSNDYPRITINNITKQGQHGTSGRDSGHVFFEQDELNADGFSHFHVIPKTIIDKYKYYKNNTYHVEYPNPTTNTEKDKYQAFLGHCESVNTDSISSNDIGDGTVEACTIDPNNEYLYALEDLDKATSDFDFTDLLLDGTRVAIPNEDDEYTVDNTTRKVIFNTDYCIDPTNTPPSLELQNCPVTMNEDTQSSVIRWIASDSDGTIQSKEATTNNGQASINTNGTITYTPDADFFGDDIVTVVVKDDDGAIARRECAITINDVNDSPTIKGTPSTIVVPGNLYSFEPVAEDKDGDTLTFSIINKPSWAIFDTASGKLSGTPTSGDIAIYPGIVISVSDGRGGEASLPAFSVEVTDDNVPPELFPDIPNQTTTENTQYTYNLAQHFRDQNGDNLTYNVSISLNGHTYSMSAPGGFISYFIPDHTAINTGTVSVEVFDGTDTISTSYELTVDEDTGCKLSYQEYFNGARNYGAGPENYWHGGSYTTNEKYRIPGNYHSIYAQYNFGAECVGETLNLSFDYKTSPNWENDEKILFRATGISNIYYDKTDGNWQTKNIQVQTSNAGWVTLEFHAKSSDNDENARIDNIRIGQ